MKIIKNRAKCLICGDVIESKYTHDFQTCSCGNLSVDGGADYCRITAKQIEKYEGLPSIIEDSEEYKDVE